MNETFSSTEAPSSLNYSPKSYMATLLLCFFFGGFGVHRFYVGKIGTGVLMLLTLGGLGVWALVDLILVVGGWFKDAEGRAIVHPKTLSA